MKTNPKKKAKTSLPPIPAEVVEFDSPATPLPPIPAEVVGFDSPTPSRCIRFHVDTKTDHQFSTCLSSKFKDWTFFQSLCDDQSWDSWTICALADCPVCRDSETASVLPCPVPRYVMDWLVDGTPGHLDADVITNQDIDVLAMLFPYLGAPAESTAVTQIRARLSTTDWILSGMGYEKNVYSFRDRLAIAKAREWWHILPSSEQVIVDAAHEQLLEGPPVHEQLLEGPPKAPPRRQKTADPDQLVRLLTDETMSRRHGRQRILRELDLYFNNPLIPGPMVTDTSAWALPPATTAAIEQWMWAGLVVVAGSAAAVLHPAMAEREKVFTSTSDIDLFILNTDRRDQAWAQISHWAFRHGFQARTPQQPGGDHSAPCVVTFVKDGHRPLQVIGASNIDTPGLVRSFDLSACQVVLDGGRVWASARALWSATTGVLAVTLGQGVRVERILKYRAKGYRTNRSFVDPPPGEEKKKKQKKEEKGELPDLDTKPPEDGRPLGRLVAREKSLSEDPSLDPESPSTHGWKGMPVRLGVIERTLLHGCTCYEHHAGRCGEQDENVRVFDLCSHTPSERKEVMEHRRDSGYTIGTKGPSWTHFPGDLLITLPPCILVPFHEEGSKGVPIGPRMIRIDIINPDHGRLWAEWKRDFIHLMRKVDGAPGWTKAKQQKHENELAVVAYEAYEGKRSIQQCYWDGQLCEKFDLDRFFFSVVVPVLKLTSGSSMRVRIHTLYGGCSLTE